MLDPQLDAPARDALAQQARGQIEAAGSLKQENTWGLRKMAYEINRRTEADYRWYRFAVRPPAVPVAPALCAKPSPPGGRVAPPPGLDWESDNDFRGVNSLGSFERERGGHHREPHARP